MHLEDFSYLRKAQLKRLHPLNISVQKKREGKEKRGYSGVGK